MTEPVMVQRPDGRPEVYDILGQSATGGLPCVMCQGTDRWMMVYPKGQIFMCSPVDAADGQAHMICLAHLPDNAVIYDPGTDMCRDKLGQNVWREG